MKLFFLSCVGRRLKTQDGPSSALTEVVSAGDRVCEEQIKDELEGVLEVIHFDEKGFPQIQKFDIYGGFDDCCFVLRNFLTPKECADIISWSEAVGFKDCGYSKEIRRAERIIAMSDSLATMLFARALPFLRAIDIDGSESLPRGIQRGCLPHGLWTPTGLNPCMRICKYKPGGFFSPHHDGGYQVSSDHRSIKTFMLYLNGDFGDGSTNFYTEDQKHYQQPAPEKLLHRYKPERGSAIVFNSALTHDGGAVTEGLKYIMRSEIMYKRQ